jgi:putative sterol carrier protein
VVEQGGAPNPDLRLRVSYQDWVDIMGERLDPLKAVATGKLRPRGNPMAIKRLAQVFPRG